MDLLLALAIALALVHFGFPLSYYTYLRVKCLGRPRGSWRDRATDLVLQLYYLRTINL